MGYSTGFLRGFLAWIALVAIGGIAIGALNELIGMGLFTNGYPAPLTGPGAGYASFAVQMGIAAGAALVVSLALDRRDHRRGRHGG